MLYLIGFAAFGLFLFACCIACAGKVADDYMPEEKKHKKFKFDNLVK